MNFRVLDQNARQRLKAAVAQSGKTASGVSVDLGYPKTYVSRLQSGEIKSPDPSRLLAICNAVQADIAYILTGAFAPPIPNSQQHPPPDARPDAPRELLDGVTQFVRKNGLISEK